MRVAEREADFRAFAAGADGDVTEPCALEAGADALHPIGAGRQVLRFEAPLPLADDHEGQTPLIILQFNKGARNRLTGGVAHHALH